MDRFDTLQLFVRIVEQGSFTKGASMVDIPRATATYAIKALEARLGTRLLERRRSIKHVGHTGLIAHPISLLQCAELDAFLQLQTHDSHDYESNADQPSQQDGFMEPDDADQRRSSRTDSCPYCVSSSQGQDL
jgi:molybdenum-dependent DNA-binding transcriptional regulator ModE